MMPQLTRAVMFFATLLLFFLPQVSGQRADHLTNEEVELVRDIQEVDLRMEIYTRAIERRLIAINGTATLGKDELKRIEKETEKWGEIPKGKFSELLADIPRILDEAVNKIEDVAERNEESDLFPFAVYILADHCRMLPEALEKLRPRAAGPRDIALINSSIDQCADIVQASEKVPRPDPKDRNKKKKKSSN